MIIDVSKLREGNTLNFNTEESIKIDPRYSICENLCNIKLETIISKENKIYIVEGVVLASFSVSCVRCLKTIPYTLEFSFSSKFSKENILNSKNNEEDIFFCEDNFLDLQDTIINNLYLNIPMKIICNENCKGLCHVCGCNFNENSCDCKNKNINPKFEVLKNMFDNKEV